tara:strand:- start:430 stop:675 length:246 start_codon:yes stop_codon:yes gene_type:complete
MTQNNRDFQKVLEALTVFDKKISTLETVVRNLAEANVNYATSQQQLNKDHAELSRELGEGIKQLAMNLSDVVKYLQEKEGN